MPTLPFRTRSIVCGILLTGLAWPMNGYADAPLPLRCVKAERPPRLDGVLNEPMWTVLEAGNVTIRGGYDSQHLYLALACKMSGEVPKALALTHDDWKIFEDDRLEIYLYQPGEPAPMYVELIINPKGVIGDFKIQRAENQSLKFDGSWESQAICGSTLTSGRSLWTVELKIPFLSLGIENPSAAKLQVMAGFTRGTRQSDLRLPWRPVIFLPPGAISLAVSQEGNVEDPGAELTRMGRELKVKRLKVLAHILEKLSQMTADGASMEEMSLFVQSQHDPFEAALGGKAVMENYVHRQTQALEKGNQLGFRAMLDVGRLMAGQADLLASSKNASEYLRAVAARQHVFEPLAQNLQASLEHVPEWALQQKMMLVQGAGMFTRLPSEVSSLSEEEFHQRQDLVTNTILNGFSILSQFQPRPAP